MAAKQLIFDENARQKILRGVELLSRAVKVTLGPEGDFDGAGEELDTAEDLLTSSLVEQELFSSHVFLD